MRVRDNEGRGVPNCPLQPLPSRMHRDLRTVAASFNLPVSHPTRAPLVPQHDRVICQQLALQVVIVFLQEQEENGIHEQPQVLRITRASSDREYEGVMGVGAVLWTPACGA